MVLGWVEPGFIEARPTGFAGIGGDRSVAKLKRFLTCSESAASFLADSDGSRLTTPP